MPHELIYTSAPRGLKPGATGYCTVAHTPDLPKDLAEQLEGISHYRHLRVDDPTGNPIAFAHSVLTTGYTVHHVLSRVADSGLDHSGRSNFLAHHVVFDTDNLPDAGPAWLCEQRLFFQKWDRGAGLLPADRAIPSGHSETRPCKKWMRLTGDAGWGGVLAAATNAAEPAYLIYEPGQDVLGLLAESMALLQPDARWGITFNTYFTGKAVRTTCQWRCVTADSPEARDALAARRGVVIRIDQPMSGAPSGPLVEAARTGEVDRPEPKRRPAPTSPVRTPRPAGIEDLPEPEPIVPASRPIRTRPSEPLPLPEDSQYDLPLPAAPRATSSKGGVGPLLLGLLLGALLILAFTSLVELAAGKSLLGFAGVKNAEAEQAKKEKEAAENDAAIRNSELRKERDAAESVKNDFRGQLIRIRDTELPALQKQLGDAQAELKALKDKPPTVVASGGGFFEGIPAWVNQTLVNKELNDANERVKRLEAELKLAKAKPAVATGGVHVLTRVEAPPPAGGPLTGITVDPAKAKLDVVGFNGNNRFNWDPGAKQVRIQKDGNSAIFTVKEDGQVVWSHTTVAGTGFLGYGNALLRIDTGKNTVQYVQFFQRKRGDLTTLDVKSPSNFANGKATYRIDTHLSKQMGSLAARNAIVRIGAYQYELEAGADSSELRSAPSNKPPVTLKVEDGGVIIVEVDRAVEGAPLSFETLDIVRIIDVVPEVGFPGCEQVLASYYPAPKK